MLKNSYKAKCQVHNDLYVLACITLHHGNTLHLMQGWNYNTIQGQERVPFLSLPRSHEHKYVCVIRNALQSVLRVQCVAEKHSTLCKSLHTTVKLALV